MKKIINLFPVMLLTFVMVGFTSCDPIYEEDDFDNYEEADSQGDSSENGALDPDFGIALYLIDGENIISKETARARKNWMEDEVKHQDIWEMTATLIPSDYRRWMTSFEIFDGDNDLLGYVANTTDDLSEWKFALDIRSAYPDGETLEQEGDYIHTIIHEYGHILALNNEQLDANQHSCDTYNPGEGCTANNSYLQAFVERFWSDILAEIEQIDEDDIDALDDFYAKYSDRFVTDYAATNPVEDLAEVFAVFVTSDNRPSGSQIKDQKIQSLYEYPELVDLREHMRGTVYTLPAPGSWERPQHKHHKGHKKE